jgi:hypothetical protein
MSVKYKKQVLIKEAIEIANLDGEEQVIQQLSPIGRRVLANVILSILPDEADDIAEFVLEDIFTNISKDKVNSIIIAETNKYLSKYINNTITNEEKALLAFLFQLQIKIKDCNILDYNKNIKEYFMKATYPSLQFLLNQITTFNVKGNTLTAGDKYLIINDDSTLKFPIKN